MCRIAIRSIATVAAAALTACGGGHDDATLSLPDPQPAANKIVPTQSHQPTGTLTERQERPNAGIMGATPP